MKKITITIKPDTSIIVPGHLQKPDVIDLEIDNGIEPIHAMEVLSATLNSLIKAYYDQIKSMQNNNTNTIN